MQGRCCADGFHCCPYGYDCDLTYTHCVREGFKYPFSPKPALTSVPASLISMSDDDNSEVEVTDTSLYSPSCRCMQALPLRRFKTTFLHNWITNKLTRFYLLEMAKNKVLSLLLVSVALVVVKSRGEDLCIGENKDHMLLIKFGKSSFAWRTYNRQCHCSTKTKYKCRSGL